MLVADYIRDSIKNERIVYGSKVMVNHGLMDKPYEPLTPASFNQLESRIEYLTTLGNPEGFEISEEINRDLAAFNLIASGSSPYTFEMEYFAGRNFNVQSDEGEINVAHCALEGILVPCLQVAAQERTIPSTVEEPLFRVADIIGANPSTIFKFYDRATELLFGEYRAENRGARKLGRVMAPREIQRLYNDLQNTVFLYEVRRYMEQRYDLTRIQAKKIFMQITRQQREIQSQDPFSSTHIAIQNRFTRNLATDLFGVHTIANVFLRDERIYATHQTNREVGQRLSLDKSMIKAYVQQNKLQYRMTSFYNPTGFNGKGFLFCEFDLQKAHLLEERYDFGEVKKRLKEKGYSRTSHGLSRFAKKVGIIEDKDYSGQRHFLLESDIQKILHEFHRRTTFISYEELGKITKKHGFSHHHTRLKPALLKHGLIDNHPFMGFGSIDPTKIDDILEVCKLEGIYSKEYKEYCKNNNLPRESSMEQFLESRKA